MSPDLSASTAINRSKTCLIFNGVAKPGHRSFCQKCQVKLAFSSPFLRASELCMPGFARTGRRTGRGKASKKRQVETPHTCSYNIGQLRGPCPYEQPRRTCSFLCVKRTVMSAASVRRAPYDDEEPANHKGTARGVVTAAKNPLQCELPCWLAVDIRICPQARLPVCPSARLPVRRPPSRWLATSQHECRCSFVPPFCPP